MTKKNKQQHKPVIGCILLATQLTYGCNRANSIQMDTGNQNHQPKESAERRGGTATDSSVVQLDPSVVQQAIYFIGDNKDQELEAILNSNSDLIHAQNLNCKFPTYVASTLGKHTYNSLLEYAVMVGSPEVLSVILNKAAEAGCLDKQLHAIDNEGHNILHLAVFSKFANLSLKLLLAHIKDVSSLVNQQREDAATPLYLCLQGKTVCTTPGYTQQYAEFSLPKTDFKHRKEVIELLLKHGADMNKKCGLFSFAYTALTDGSAANIETFMYLLNNGLQVFANDLVGAGLSNRARTIMDTYKTNQPERIKVEDYNFLSNMVFLHMADSEELANATIPLLSSLKKDVYDRLKNKGWTDRRISTLISLDPEANTLEGFNEEEIKDLSSIPFTQNNICALLYYIPDLVNRRLNAMHTLDLERFTSQLTALDGLSKFPDRNKALQVFNLMIKNLVHQNHDHDHDQETWRQDLCAIWVLRCFAKHNLPIDRCAEEKTFQETIQRIWESHLERYVDPSKQSYDTLLYYEKCFYNAFEHYFNELEYPHQKFLNDRNAVYKDTNSDVYDWLSNNKSIDLDQVAKLNKDLNDQAEYYFNEMCKCIRKLKA